MGWNTKAEIETNVVRAKTAKHLYNLITEKPSPKIFPRGTEKPRYEVLPKKAIKTAYKPSTSLTTKELPSNACVTSMKKYFPKDLWRMGYAIMMAESTARPNAISRPDGNPPKPNYGCWQIHGTPRALDPDTGTKIALYKFNHSGWNPWGVYTSGRYLRWY